MDIEQASNFLIGSLLNSIGFVVICIAITVVNNVFAKYWKPVNIWYFGPLPGQETSDRKFETSHNIQKTEPVVETSTTK
jgi:hypothetical protein